MYINRTLLHSLCLFCSQHFKNVKKILTFRALQKQALDLIWPSGHNLPVPKLEHFKSKLYVVIKNTWLWGYSEEWAWNEILEYSRRPHFWACGAKAVLGKVLLNAQSILVFTVAEAAQRQLPQTEKTALSPLIKRGLAFAIGIWHQVGCRYLIHGVILLIPIHAFSFKIPIRDFYQHFVRYR